MSDGRIRVLWQLPSGPMWEWVNTDNDILASHFRSNASQYEWRLENADEKRERLKWEAEFREKRRLRRLRELHKQQRRRRLREMG